MKKVLVGMAVLLMTAVAMNAAAESAYTVTFNVQGGSAVASQSVTAGSTVPYPAEPTKPGVFFDGWYNEVACTTPYNYTVPVSGPITLYALWLTESDMIAKELGASVPAGNIFEVNNSTATAEGQPGWNSSWAKVIATINAGGGGSNAANSKNYVIKVTSNFQLAGVSSSTFTPGNVKVLIYAPANKTISLSGRGDLLYAGANQTLILRNITLQGSARNNDSMVYSSGTNAHLIMHSGAVIKDNNAGGGGGVDVNSGGTFTMSGGTISGNSTSDSGGGGVVVNGGTFTMSGGIISGNSASSFGGGGGGVYVAGGTFTMSGGTISGNNSYYPFASSACGGGVYVAGGTFTMNGGTISGNNTSSFYHNGDGGGVCVGVGILFTMSGGTISGNSASDDGGGIYVNGGIFTMSGGSISGNKTTYSGSGGGVYICDGTFTMNDGTINTNHSNGDDGGGVYVGGGTFTMSGGSISGNSANRDNGGGVYVSGDTFTMRNGSRYFSSGTFTMSGGTISGNSASNGGGVYFANGTFTMGGGTISGNSASNSGGGGGVYVARDTFTMGGGTISSNTASGSGGGVRINGGTFWLMGGTVYGRGAGTGLANTASSGASLSIKDTTAIAKYGNFSDIIESGLATDATLVGHD
jgi:uncharacterized repeat protein (TIGR02543 family)